VRLDEGHMIDLAINRELLGRWLFLRGGWPLSQSELEFRVPTAPLSVASGAFNWGASARFGFRLRHFESLGSWVYA
jgi:hypothetical protein